MNIIVFGAQGSGKSTHAHYIADKLGFPYIYTGDLFRELENENSQRGKKIKELMDKGILIPNELSIPAFKEYLAKFDIAKGLVLDGYPRNLEQVQDLEIKPDLILYIILPEDVAIERLRLRGRTDDTPESIKTRLNLYREQTAPLIDYYKKLGVEVIEVDNQPPVEEVRAKIDELLKIRSGH